MRERKIFEPLAELLFQMKKHVSHERQAIETSLPRQFLRPRRKGRKAK